MQSQPLKKVLLSNAAFSALTGLVLIAAHPFIAQLMGGHPQWIYLALGIGLCVFAVDVGFIATRNKINEAWVKLILAADVAWVIASVAIIAFGQTYLSYEGNVLILTIALLVTLFSLLEYQYINTERTRAYPV
ncbi:MAG: hypothetical protein MI976_10580 [Pseudomonadales bacterium]|nr:hypothetical protein [Pseudomonadales bacterium]